jgi:hypothetical protein
MTPQQIFNPGGPVVAVFEADHLGRRAAGLGEGEKIGIGGDDRKPIGSRIHPNALVRCEPGKTRLENVNGTREKLRKATNELR